MMSDLIHKVHVHIGKKERKNKQTNKHRHHFSLIISSTEVLIRGRWSPLLIGHIVFGSTYMSLVSHDVFRAYRPSQVRSVAVIDTSGYISDVEQQTETFK